MPRVTSNDLYQMLTAGNQNVRNLEGQITFSFGGVNIIVRKKDVIGNIVQEWLKGWLQNNDIEFNENTNPQMPPDFFLDPENLQHNLLEVKAFNRRANPGFDIADFNAFARELIEQPWMLDADYLIFGYNMSENGTITVEDIWLKKIWEITSCSQDWPLKLQVKQQVVHKIRPCVWYSRRTRFRPFESKEDFLSAFEQTVYQNRDTRDIANQWENRFLEAYRDYCNEPLNIRRWTDIEERYREPEVLNEINAMPGLNN